MRSCGGLLPGIAATSVRAENFSSRQDAGTLRADGSGYFVASIGCACSE